jgi:cobalt-zinc-cadmium efflux system outer membrane protein
MPLAIFDRNQGEIARTRSVITQMQEQQAFTNGQVLTDVKDAYEGLKSMDKVVLLYRDKYRDIAKKERDIADYAYHRGALALLDFLDAERSYRAAELGYRQTLASYLLAVEQLREAVGVRNLQ